MSFTVTKERGNIMVTYDYEYFYLTGCKILQALDKQVIELRIPS